MLLGLAKVLTRISHLEAQGPGQIHHPPTLAARRPHLPRQVLLVPLMYVVRMKVQYGKRQMREEGSGRRLVVVLIG